MGKCIYHLLGRMKVSRAQAVQRTRRVGLMSKVPDYGVHRALGHGKRGRYLFDLHERVISTCAIAKNH